MPPCVYLDGKNRNGKEVADMTRWHIFNKLTSLKDWVHRLFGRMRFHTHSEDVSWSDWLAPVIDVHDTPDKVLYEIELPGVERKDIDVKVRANLLTIQAQRKHSRKARRANWLWSESLYGSFATSLVMPENTDPESIRTEYADGVLSIEVAKKAWARPRRIPIQTGGLAANRGKAA